MIGRHLCDFLLHFSRQLAIENGQANVNRKTLTVLPLELHLLGQSRVPDKPTEKLAPLIIPLQTYKYGIFQWECVSRESLCVTVQSSQSGLITLREKFASEWKANFVEQYSTP